MLAGSFQYLAHGSPMVYNLNHKELVQCVSLKRFGCVKVFVELITTRLVGIVGLERRISLDCVALLSKIAGKAHKSH